MSAIGGPNTVDDNLILSYDVANIKSFRGEPTANTVPFPSAGASRYNNPSFSGAITNTGLTYKGSPIWEVTFIPQNSSFISRLGSTEGFGFLHSMGISLLGNTPYIASVYFKTDFPLANTSTQGFNNGYSNISGWNNSGTSSTRYEEDGWTRLWTRFLNNITIGGIGYAFRGNNAQNTVTVNTTSTTDIIVTVNLLSNATITSTTNINTSGASGFSNSGTLVGVYAVSPTIISTNIAGMSTGTSTIINHGTETTNWTKISSANPLPRSNFPTPYYIQVRVPSTGGINQTFVLRPRFTGYYTAISDSKYWKVTFDTTNLQVGQVIRTYWTAPMIEQRSVIGPTNFTIGTRGATVATGGGLIDLSGDGNSGTLVNDPIYDNSDLGSLVFDGVDDLIQTNFGNGYNVFTNNLTVSAWVKSDTTSGQRMWLDVGSNGTNQRFYSSIVTAGRSDFGIQSSGWVSGIPVDTNWHHQTLVMNNGIALYYDNGIQVQSKNYTSYILPSNIRLGGRGSSFQWEGKISNVQIYNRALTPQEIQQNYNATKGRFGL